MKKTLIIAVFILYNAVFALGADFQQTLKLAEQGDAAAQFDLGVSYIRGEGVPIDYKQAVEWLRKAAQQGDAEAQLWIGVAYANGEGVPQDHKQAAEWYRKAADQGHADAQYNLGVMYANGEGVPQDYKQAVEWYRKAAEQGIKLAQFNLGLNYENGKGVPQDYKQAVEWYTKAAEQGDAEAQNSLGVKFVKGRGVPQNYTYAYAWFSLSAAQGIANAIKNRDQAAKLLTPEQMSRAQELAATIQRKIDHPASQTEQSYPPSTTHGAQPNSSGTGFLVTTDGHILTCYHVVFRATSVKVKTENRLYSAQVVRTDPANDLALLKITGSFPALALSADRSARMGQEVFTIGYPNPDLQGISPKLTKGEVNSLTGFQDDIRLYQISIPVQPGNSGGPLLDMGGNFIGVIVAMLNAQTAFKATGSLPQNVNYAVKSTYARALLDTIPNVADRLPSPSNQMSFERVVEKANKSVVMVLSYE